MTDRELRRLIKLAKRQKTVALTYRKGVTNDTAHERTVEPYNFVQGKQDVMVYCYQVAPKEGWRFFMLHRIESVKDAGFAYEPRRPVTLPTGEIEQRYQQSPDWSDPKQMYRDLVSDGLADWKLTEKEAIEIIELRAKHKLSLADIRFVHASLYHRCLGAVVEDGFLTNTEVRQIRYLHKMLGKLGWCVGD